MRVFVGMETSGQVRRRMARLGHDVISCDLLPADDDMPLAGAGRHMQGDVFEVLEYLERVHGWVPDIAVFHPTCTMHTVSAAWAFNDPDYDRYPGVGYHQRVQPGTLTGKARHAARIVAEAELERIKALKFKKIVENPKGTIPTRTSYGKPMDVVQPYEFGDDASKGTCLWAFDENGDRLEFKIVRDPEKYVKPRLVCDQKHTSEWGNHKCVVCGSHSLSPRWSNQTDSNQNKLTPSETRWKERSRTFDGVADAIVEVCVGLA